MNPTSPQQIDELLRSKGLNPEDVRSRINQHIQSTFGTPERYAQAIMSKQQGQLSDPQTAEAFRAIAPALFGEGPKPLGYDPNRPGVMSFNFGQTAPVPAGANMHPSARAALDAIGQYQQANPFTIPVAPGTKARWQLQDEEAMRAQAAQEAMAQEKWDWEKDMTERQFAYRQQQDAIANALAQLKASAGGAGGYGPETPWGAIDALVSAGASLDDIMEYVDHPYNLASYKQYGVTVDAMRDYAQSKYGNLWQQIMGFSGAPSGAAPADVARGFRQAEGAASRIKGLRQVEEAASEKELAKLRGQKLGKFTEADYQMFAAATGKTVDEIRRMDELGMLEDLMKKFYSAQYVPPEDDLKEKVKESMPK